ncbi:MAG: phosphate ABC transporter permease subunit PstC [Planctomycetota bacterium]|nr:MAG: phosphate ABC transporter permease subunit PstC [Planctomycetota bacterium]
MRRALAGRKVFTFDQGIKYFFLFNASIAIVAVMAIIAFLLEQGLPFFREESAASLLGRRWVPYLDTGALYGIIPLAAATAWAVVLSMLAALPMGVCAALYISEIAGPKERTFLKNFIEILASFPSVVLGFFALAVIAPLVKRIFDLPSGMTLLTASIVLSVMALPTVISVSEDAIRNVPMSYRRASLALGASRLATLWRVVLPAAKSGVIAALMLGTGRVVGETMAVLMVTGGSPVIPASPLSAGRPMTATIASEMGEVVYGSTHYSALFLIGSILLFITLGINLVIIRMTAGRE